jgi:imipenem/basic amino acid-specific outer membrane pore
MHVKTIGLILTTVAMPHSARLYAADTKAQEQLQGHAGLGQLYSQAKVSSQANSNGFIEDSKLDLVSRNYAFQRDFKNNTTYSANGQVSSQNMTNEWAQGEMLNYASGFTQGSLGFGLDAFAYLGLKLSSGNGYGGTGLLPNEHTRSDGNKNWDGNDDYSKASGAVKLRASETVAKYGEMRIITPVFGTGDSRLLPEGATGLSIVSAEISPLIAEAGRFTAYSERDSSDFDDDLIARYAKTETNSISYLGGTYRISEQLSSKLFAAEAENIWRQYYANLTYSQALTDSQAIGVVFDIYRTNDYGDKSAGNIGNTTFSLAPSYSLGAHRFTLAYQQVRGETPFDWVGGHTYSLANAPQYTDFNAAGEKSYQARYDLDMSSFGMPGLSFMTRYVIGSGMDNSGDNSGVYSMNDNGTPNNSADDFRNNSHGGKEWEQNFATKYVIQQGAAKGLSMRLREAVYRGNTQANSASGFKDANELRLIIEYPLSIL